MIVVSDTTPLNYLVLINEVGILPKLFEAIYVPRIVLHELSHPRAPVQVREWADSPPSWLTVVDPSQRLSSTLTLDQGEAEAISLAVELRIQNVLIDERRGSGVARREGLLPLPTLAILEKAAEIQLVSLPMVVGKLQRTSIRIS